MGRILAYLLLFNNGLNLTLEYNYFRICHSKDSTKDWPQVKQPSHIRRISLNKSVREDISDRRGEAFGQLGLAFEPMGTTYKYIMHSSTVDC